MSTIRLPSFLHKLLHSEKNEKNDSSSGTQHKLEREQFEQVLKTFKASRIEERMDILDAFLSIEQHLTFSDLEEIIRKKKPSFDDRAFLLETMDMFCQFGFAYKKSFGSQETFYEHHHLGAHHDHFICTRCGLIQEFSNEELERLQLVIARDYDFHPLQHKMEVFGLCAKCMAQRDTKIPLPLAAIGEEVCIVEIAGGRSVQARLAAMGLAVGACLEVISHFTSGPTIVANKETRLALDAGIANKIIVTHSCRHPKDH